MNLTEARDLIAQADTLRADCESPEALSDFESRLAFARMNIDRLESEELERRHEAARPEAERLSERCHETQAAVRDSQMALIAAVEAVASAIEARDATEAEFHDAMSRAAGAWQAAGEDLSYARQRTGWGQYTGKYDKAAVAQAVRVLEGGVRYDE